ncbi:MAG: ATP-binding protein [Dorea sp.]|nr:ATP-binding protein [Dorea sp.]
MNCSFLQNSHIEVAIYDDRLEITSPGGLLPGMTIEKMQEGYSKIRNKALAHAFLYMNMIGGWESDIPKIMREMKEYGLREPEFIDMGIGFRINLYRKQDVDPSQQAYYTSQETNQEPYNASREMNQEKISETELNNTDKIRNAIAKSPSVTQQELQELTGLSRSGVRYILQQMRAAGKLERIGSTKKGKWILKV